MLQLSYLDDPIRFLLYLYVFIIGSCIFSYLNVLIYRVPRRIDFVKGRSFCPTCHHELRAKDLVPLFSWLFLRRRCRYCGEPISSRYFWVELLGGGMGCLSLARFGLSWQMMVGFAFFAICAIISLVDWDTMEIPNGFVIAMLVVALVSIPVFPEISAAKRLIGLAVVSVPMLLLSLAIPGAFGGGDIKLMAAAGLLLGWKLTLVSMFLAVLTGGYGIYLLAGKKKGRKDHFAFGPFLCIGMTAALLWGQALLDWYLRLLGVY
ncbi:MAG: prepilin peptidase [Lachnospiraceae bacterium]|nr:prepilin peptidase [Lachnospiraceae bacterium]